MLEYQNTEKHLRWGYTTNWTAEVFVMKKVKNTVPLTNVLEELNREESVGSIIKKNCERQMKESLELTK